MKKLLKILCCGLLLSVGVSSLGGCGEQVGQFKLVAIVSSVGEHVEAEVIQSDYAFGVYWILTPDSVRYYDENGERTERDRIKPGDKIEVTYGGQVMMSYPPQIVAHSVKIIERGN